MNYQSSLTYSSEFDPSVSYRLRKPSYHRNMDLDLQLAEFRARIRLIGKRHKALLASIEAQKKAFEIEKRQTLVKLQLQRNAQPDDAELAAKIAALEASEYEMPDEVVEQLEEMNEESLRAMAKDYNPVVIRWAVKEGTGLVIDGNPAGISELVDFAPRELSLEILNRIEALRGMSGEELKNLQSPSTSSSTADGETSATTATPAGASTSTAPATAPSTSPS